MARWWGLLLLASAGGFVRGETLTVATYNIANYNLTNRVADGIYRPDYPKPESEKAALRRVIRELDAEVLALQEVGGAAFLRELQRDLRREGCDYPFTALLDAGEEPRHLAVLSRRPLRAERHHRDLTFAYDGGRQTVRRGLLEVRIAAGGGELVLFVVHLKSRYTEREDDPMAGRWRAGEAVAVRDRVLEVVGDPEVTRFIIAGDLNAGPRERPVQALRQRGERVFAALVPAADSRGERWTHAYRRDDSYSRVDHILVSPALQPALRDGRGRIHDGPGVAEASDHRPVVVTFEWTP